MTTISCGRVTPIMRMFDEALTKDFYLGFLEFELVFEHRFDDSAPLYMGVKKGECVLHLSQHFGDGSPGAAVRIETTGLDEFARLLRGKQYRYARPGDPAEQTWGSRELTLTDPSGNSLTFFTDV